MSAEPSRPGPTQEAETRLGGYRVESVLGRGGMGEVHLAFDERLRRRVAIKRVRADASLDADLRARLRREAQAVARLNHPAIVQIYDILEGADGDRIVMEYVEGKPLDEHIAEGELDLSLALRLAREIADGLGEAHAKGLIHRDLKTENVIVTPTGHAKILDFGLARPLWRRERFEERRGERTEGPTGPLTEPGLLVGTAHAMSPEQAASRPLDHRSDLFAFGVLIYEMLTGRSPFRGDDLVDTLRRLATEDPEPVSELRPETPEALVDLVERLLEKDPERRPANARRVAAELAEIRPLAEPSAATRHADDPRSDLGDPRSDLGDLPTGSGLLPVAAPRSGSPGIWLAVRFFHDARRRAPNAARATGAAQELWRRWNGSELETTPGGWRLRFEKPEEAVAYALALHPNESGRSDAAEPPPAGVGIHQGDPQAGPLHRHLAQRLAALAAGGQTLLTRAAFDQARRAEIEAGPATPRWLAHGAYEFQDHADPIEVFEVGVEGSAPLAVPPDSPVARRAVPLREELTLGWRPALGQFIPRRSHWRLEDKLGEGGFGEVWLAKHRATHEKRVFKFCLEATRLRALQREVTLFRLLRDVLGERDDIARILDWNFDVAPFFLESAYTEGGSLIQWAERQGGLAEVPLACRLELAAEVAEALAAAHSVGILHKDVKPANVLIAEDRHGRPRGRLADFGIGGVIDPEVLDERGITVLGFSADSDSAESSDGGTLRYLAPELTGGQPATVRSDLYAFGVLLYQLVAGDFTRPLAPGWRRHVADGLLAADIAELVDGSPERRPASALEAAERIRSLDARRARIADDERRREAAERARRDLEHSRRRRRLLTAAVAVSAVVLVVISLFALDARRARGDADRRRAQAEGLIDFMLGDLRPKLRRLGRLDVLEDVGNRALEYFAAIPEQDLSDDELESRSQALYQLGSVRFELGQLEDATQAFRKSLELAQDLANRDPQRAEWQFALGQSHFWVGFLLFKQRDPYGAMAQFESYRTISQALVNRDPTHDDWRLELAYAHSNIASALEAQADSEGARAALLASTQLLEDLVERRPELAVELAHVHGKLGSSLEASGHLADAKTHHLAALAIFERELAESPNDSERIRFLATAHHQVGDVLYRLDDLEGALEHYRRDLELTVGLVDRDPENVTWRRELGLSHNKLGRVLLRIGRPEASLDHFQARHTIAAELVTLDPEHSEWQLDLAISHYQLARAQQGRDRSKVARREVEQALRILDSITPQADDPQIDRWREESRLLLRQIHSE